MNYGKTLDGSYDLNVDNLDVNESSRLGGSILVDGSSKFQQDVNLENLVEKKIVILSASEVVVDYELKLPPTGGNVADVLTTDGEGKSSWLPPATDGTVKYIAISPPDGFMTVNGMGSDSTTTSKTFNLELSGVLPPDFGGTGLDTTGLNNELLISKDGILEWNSEVTIKSLDTETIQLLDPILGLQLVNIDVASFSAALDYSITTAQDFQLQSLGLDGTGSITVSALGLGTSSVTILSASPANSSISLAALGSTASITIVAAAIAGTVSILCGGLLSLTGGALTVTTGVITLTGGATALTFGALNLTAGATAIELGVVTANTGALNLNAGATIINTAGLFTVSTGAGACSLLTAAGAIALTTGGGAIALTTGGGVITVTVGAGLLSLLTIAGGILISAIGGGIEIVTTIGGVKVTCGSGNTEVSSGAGSVYIYAPVGGIEVGRTGNRNGNFIVYTTNGATAPGTANVEFHMSSTGLNTGPGNFIIDTAEAKNGDVIWDLKGGWDYNGIKIYSAPDSDYSYILPKTGGVSGSILMSGGKEVLFPAAQSWLSPGESNNILTVQETEVSVTGSRASFLFTELDVSGGIDTFPVGSTVYLEGFTPSDYNSAYSVVGGNSTSILIFKIFSPAVTVNGVVIKKSPVWSASGNLSMSTLHITSSSVSALLVGADNTDTSPTSVLIQNNTNQNLLLGVSGGTDNFSLSAEQGDSVIKVPVGRNLILQSGDGEAGLVFDVSNNVVVKNLLKFSVVSSNPTIDALQGAIVLGYNTPKQSGGRDVFQVYDNSTNLNNLFTVTTGGILSGSNLVTVNTTLNVTSLTASYSVHTDSSKNLVSIQNSGTGLNVLQTSPTLVTPTISMGSAITTVFTHSGAGSVLFLSLNAGMSVANSHIVAFGRDSSVYNCASIQFNYNALNSSLNTLGFGFAGSNNLMYMNGAGVLNLSSLTASYSVHTDASKNLVSIQNSGTGLNVLQTSPTLVTPVIGLATGTSLSLTGNLTTGLVTISQAFGNATIDSSTGALIIGFNTPKITTQRDTLQVYNNITDRVALFKVISAGSSSGSNSVEVNTTLNVSTLTASRLVLTDGSKNLTSLSAGSNGNVLTIVSGAPTWAAPATSGKFII